MIDVASHRTRSWTAARTSSEGRVSTLDATLLSAGSARDPDVARLGRRHLAGIGLPVDLVARLAVLPRLDEQLGLDRLTDRLFAECGRGPHEFRGLRPVSVVVVLQLEAVAVGIQVVE